MITVTELDGTPVKLRVNKIVKVSRASGLPTTKIETFDSWINVIESVSQVKKKMKNDIKERQFALNI